MTFALLPAGGHSVRMGRPKLALPIGGRTVLEQVILALHAAAVDHVLVVLGPHVADLASRAKEAGAHVHVLTEATPDMRTTVEHGLRWLEHRFHPQPTDSWLLVPADHPTLEPDVVRQLLQARDSHPDSSVFIPTYQGKRGHPTLIGWRHVEALRTLPVGQGLNIYLRQQAGQALLVPVDAATVLLDLDTPEDYERLLRSWPSD